MLKFLKSLFAPGSPIPDEPVPLSPDDPNYGDRLADLILGEIKLYQGKTIAKARRDLGLAETLEPDVRRSYEMFVSRVGDGEGHATMFRSAMLRVFGDDAPILEPLLQKVLLQRGLEKQK